MQRLAWLAALALTVAIAGCGEADESGSGANPDQPVQAPARHDPAPSPPPPKECKRVGRSLRGESLTAAQSTVREARCELRVVVRDGQNLAVTDDFSPSRINVRVDGGEVVEIVGYF